MPKSYNGTENPEFTASALWNGHCWELMENSPDVLRKSFALTPEITEPLTLLNVACSVSLHRTFSTFIRVIFAPLYVWKGPWTHPRLLLLWERNISILPYAAVLRGSGMLVYPFSLFLSCCTKAYCVRGQWIICMSFERLCALFTEDFTKTTCRANSMSVLKAVALWHNRLWKWKEKEKCYIFLFFFFSWIGKKMYFY